MSLLRWVLVLPLVGWLAAPAAAQEVGRKTNVLIIAVDDLNTSLGCYGHPLVKTPNIDRLAKRGVMFSRAYCQYPLCNPSRTSFMSGRRPDTTKIIDNGTPPRTTLGDVVFLNEYFARHGYFTARVGKIYHGTFADASRWDVDENAGPKQKKAGEVALFEQKQKKTKKEKGQQGGIKISWQATNRDDGDEPDGRTARRIAQLLEQNKGRPFFIAAGFHKPHLAFIAPQKYFDMYPPDKIALPKEPPDFRKNVPPLAFTRTPSDDTMTDDEKKQGIAAYYACVSFMDAQVGVILNAMDRLNLWDNTIVILLGDHGFHLSDHGNLWRKMTLFEMSCRVPLIIAAPDGQRGRQSPRLAELVDLYPTLTEYCRLPAPKDLDGASLVPRLSDPDRPWKKAAFTVVARGKNGLGRTVRTERYRYTEWPGGGAELYDHQSDPNEYANLAVDPSQQGTVEELRRILREGWQATRPPGKDK